MTTGYSPNVPREQVKSVNVLSFKVASVFAVFFNLNLGNFIIPLLI